MTTLPAFATPPWGCADASRCPVRPSSVAQSGRLCQSLQGHRRRPTVPREQADGGKSSVAQRHHELAAAPIADQALNRTDRRPFHRTGQRQSDRTPRSAFVVANGWPCVIHFWHMGHTITVRLEADLATWLEQESANTGMSQGKIVRDQLEKAKAGGSVRPFMRLAGAARGARDLSSRKGFRA